MNNLKKLKLVVASALLSSTAVYADDCTDTSATNCGITISGNQTIDIDSSISTTNQRGVQVTGDSNTLTIDGISTSFKGDEENTYFNMGVGLDYQLTNGIKAYVAGNFMDSSDEIHSVSGSFGVMGSF